MKPWASEHVVEQERVRPGVVGVKLAAQPFPHPLEDAPGLVSSPTNRSRDIVPPVCPASAITPSSDLTSVPGHASPVRLEGVRAGASRCSAHGIVDGVERLASVLGDGPPERLEGVTIGRGHPRLEPIPGGQAVDDIERTVARHSDPVALFTTSLWLGPPGE